MHRLEEFEGVVEVHDVEVAVGGADYEELVPHVHGVDAVLAGDGAGGGGLPQVPVFYGFVPGAGDEHGVAGVFEELDAADGRVVGGDLGGCRGVAGA